MAEMARHRVLREILRNYLTFESLCTQSGEYVIEYKGLSLSFCDLQDCLRRLSPRKKEAVVYNVILDYKQKDVAALMGITTVSVGQYVEAAMVQIAQKYFAEMDEKEISDVSGLSLSNGGSDLGAEVADHGSLDQAGIEKQPHVSSEIGQAVGHA